MGIHIGRASLIVEDPSQELKESLRFFRRNLGGEGRYEDLYVLSEDGKRLVTMPGFADRVIRIARKGCTRVYDERVPMPKPDMDKAQQGLHECWRGVVSDALKNEGGVISIPDILDEAEVAAAILRAYPRDSLVDRATPVSVVAARDRNCAVRIMRRLREILPERDIGLIASGTYTDSDDVVVSTYAALRDIQSWEVGVFIACNLTFEDFV